MSGPPETYGCYTSEVVSLAPSPSEQHLLHRLAAHSGAIAAAWLDHLQLPTTTILDAETGEFVRNLIAGLAASQRPPPTALEPFARTLADAPCNEEPELCAAAYALGLLLSAGLRAGVDEATAAAETIDPRLVATLAERIADRISSLAEIFARLTRATRADELRIHRDDLSRFAHWTAHEVKNRVGVASLALAMLERAIEAGDRARTERLIARLQATLTQLVHTPSELVVIAFGRHLGELRRSPGALAPVIVAVVSELYPFAEHRGVDIELGELPALTVDTSRLRLIVGTLLHNAIKYITPGSERSWVRIELHPLEEGGLEERGPEESRRRWRLDVRDNGTGIPPELLGSIFAAGVRAHPEEPGQGIGLALAQIAAHQLGGALTVESHPGEGSTFSLTFTAEGPAASPAAIPPAPGFAVEPLGSIG